MHTLRHRVALLTGTLTAILGLTLIACMPGDGDSGGSSNGQSGTRRTAPAPIDGIEILTRESAPPGYTAHITSGLPSGCAQFEKAEITSRDESTVTISVTNTLPADKNVACTAIYGYQESNIDLGMDFVSGQTYTIKVNDEQTTFTAQ